LPTVIRQARPQDRRRWIATALVLILAQAVLAVAVRTNGDDASDGRAAYDSGRSDVPRP
jgi:hypothetical protein